MKKISVIEAKIESISPLYIGDDEGNVLIDNENNMAYLPATSIAGAFRAYLNSIGEEVDHLFGETEDSQMSKIYISDCHGKVQGFERRDGVSIDGETGANKHGSKIQRLYLSEGIEFHLKFKIHMESEEDNNLKIMIYKALNGLNKSFIRFGGHKSSGLGIFKVKSAEEMEYDFNDLENLKKYLKREPVDKKDIMTEVNKEYNTIDYVEFTLKGELTTPLIIKSPRSFDPDEADDTSLKTNSGKYLIPGSSFKGVLRSRVETISNYFGILDKAQELFGQVEREDKDNILSRIFVKEAEIDNTEYSKTVTYNRIKLDKFTSGVKYGSLMEDEPVKGSTEFHILYRKTGDKAFDDFAIGIISLALRDLGTENLGLGGNANIGRGRFKGSSMTIKNGAERIHIDFENKRIDNEEVLSTYIAAVKKLSGEVMDNG